MPRSSRTLDPRSASAVVRGLQGASFRGMYRGECDSCCSLRETIGSRFRNSGDSWRSHLEALLTGALLALIGIISWAFAFRSSPWAFLGLAALAVLWAAYQAFHEIRLERDDLLELPVEPEITPRESEQWGERSESCSTST